MSGPRPRIHSNRTQPIGHLEASQKVRHEGAQRLTQVSSWNSVGSFLHPNPLEAANPLDAQRAIQRQRITRVHEPTKRPNGPRITGRYGPGRCRFDDAPAHWAYLVAPAK